MNEPTLEELLEWAQKNKAKIDFEGRGVIVSFGENGIFEFENVHEALKVAYEYLGNPPKPTFTPGDWAYDPKGGAIYSKRDPQAGYQAIARVHREDGKLVSKQNSNDGRLMARSKDMLDMLKDVLSQMNGNLGGIRETSIQKLIDQIEK